MTLKLIWLADVEAEIERRESLPLTDPENPYGFERDDENGGWDIWWGGYEYFLQDAQVATPMLLLSLVHHMGEKEWEGATSYRIAQFIDAVSRENGWALYAASTAPQPRTTSNTAERAKLTPKLRYSILMRDDNRCRACGASPETGAHLHIDHITAIANGGKTEADNLQALCSACNFGKGAA